jgi:hypothetical protein
VVGVRCEFDEAVVAQSVDESLDALALDAESSGDARHGPVAVGRNAHDLPSRLGLPCDASFGIAEAPQRCGRVEHRNHDCGDLLRCEVRRIRATRHCKMVSHCYSDSLLSIWKELVMSAVEIARFRVERETEEALLASWVPMVDAMKRAHPALESVRLVRFEDGTWADIAIWADQDAAQQACTIQPLPEVEEFFRHIAEDVSLDVTTLVRQR